MRPGLQKLLAWPGESRPLRSIKITGSPTLILIQCGNRFHYGESVSRQQKRSVKYRSISEPEGRFQGHKPSVACIPDDGLSSQLRSVSKRHLSGSEIDIRKAVVSISRRASTKLIGSSQPELSLEAWISRLRHSVHLHGTGGALVVWQELRGQHIDIPTNGRLAAFFWWRFLHLGFDDEEFLEELVSYADNLLHRKHMRWPYLYQAILEHYLPHGPGSALRWHTRLVELHRPRRNSMKTLAFVALRSPKSLEAFRVIYLENTKQKNGGIYSTLIPKLCAQEQWEAATEWHFLLMGVGDKPEDHTVPTPLMSYLAIHGGTHLLHTFTQGLIKAGVNLSPSSAKGPVNTSPLVLSRETMSRSLGDRFHVAEKTLSERFCARLFATPSFSVDSVMSGLQMVGVTHIGPTVLREICLRESGVDGIEHRLKQLQQANISTGSSTFTRVVKKLVRQNDWETLRDVLESDQHPEVLEDLGIQGKLLMMYAASQNWRQLKRTTAILEELAPNPTSSVWHLHSKELLQNTDKSGTSQTLGQMHDRRLALSSGTLELSSRNFDSLPTAQEGSLAASGETSPLVSLNKELLSADSQSARHWRLVLAAFAKTLRFKEMEIVALWLAKYYASGSTDHSMARLKPYSAFVVDKPGGSSSNLSNQLEEAGRRSHNLSKIFTPAIQKGIVAWSFKRAWASLPNVDIARTKLDAIGEDSHHDHWTWGLRLLKQLEAQGVQIYDTAVRNECACRFLILFATGRPKSRLNRRGRALNPHKLSMMIQRVHEIWGWPLLDDDYHLEARKRLTSPALPKSSGLVRFRDFTSIRQRGQIRLEINRKNLADSSPVLL